MLYCQVNKLVLCFSLDHPRALGSDHLDCALDINFTVQPYTQICTINTKLKVMNVAQNHSPFFFS